MDARFVILVLSLAAAAKGITQEEIETGKDWSVKYETMELCMEQENVSLDEMRKFFFHGKNEDDNEPLKRAIYCFSQKMNFFDGVTWNIDAIAKAESKSPELLQVAKDCLEKDDFTLQPHERAYQAQKCILQNGGLE